MKRNVNSLVGFSMDASDGEIGKVAEFYFDDDSWTIRYLILKTGNWWSGRELLISPQAIKKNTWETGMFPVDLTKEQIRNSPDIDTRKPVSRQQEIELYGHYPWQSYWGSGYYPGGVWGITDQPPIVKKENAVEADHVHKRSGDDVHLRSTLQVTGYHVEGIDGKIGHVKDFIMDDQTWKMLYLVISTHIHFGGKEVLIAVEHIKKIEWNKSNVFVDLTVASMEKSEAFDSSDFFVGETANAAHDKPAIPLK